MSIHISSPVKELRWNKQTHRHTIHKKYIAFKLVTYVVLRKKRIIMEKFDRFCQNVSKNLAFKSVHRFRAKVTDQLTDAQEANQKMQRNINLIVIEFFLKTN